jgi:hypothetical protein
VHLFKLPMEAERRSMLARSPWRPSVNRGRGRRHGLHPPSLQIRAEIEEVGSSPVKRNSKQLTSKTRFFGERWLRKLLEMPSFSGHQTRWVPRGCPSFYACGGVPPGDSLRRSPTAPPPAFLKSARPQWDPPLSGHRSLAAS